MSPFLLLAAIALGPQSRDGVMVLAGGCFWGVEAVFEHVLGVRSVTSGFARPADAEKGFVPVEAVRFDGPMGRAPSLRFLACRANQAYLAKQG